MKQTLQFVILNKRFAVQIFLLVFIFILSPTGNVNGQKSKIIIGYVGGYGGLINTAPIVAMQVDYINYAFVDMKNNRAWLRREATDTINFRHLNLLKKQNPS